MPSDTVEYRSARLRFLLDMAMTRHAIEITVPDDLTLTDEQREDLHLTNALITVEHERLQRHRAALERLLNLVPPDGDVDEVVQLPESLAVHALCDLYELGWLRD